MHDTDPGSSLSGNPEWLSTFTTHVQFLTVQVNGTENKITTYRHTYVLKVTNILPQHDEVHKNR